ncbi:MAG TPA: LpqB family beta-propeller domain-containing protein [Pyrinomonadaceae bacterium]|jgi:TolB protein
MKRPPAPRALLCAPLIPLLLFVAAYLCALVARAQDRPAASPPAVEAVFYQDVSWSPDGRRFACTMKRGESWDIYTMRADGAQPARLTTPPGKNFYTAWSPDGRRLAFGARRDGDKTDIYTMNADGSRVVRLTHDAGNNATPAWSPDGRRIAFISDRDGGGYQLYVMRADGTAQTRLLNDDARHFNPQWSPDGRRLVYYTERGDQQDQVFVVNADGTHPLRVTGGTGHNIFPAWSPDGARLLFTARRDGATEFQMYTVRADGSDLRRLAAQPAFFARFAPDGRRVAFIAGKYPANAVYVMRADGTQITQLAPPTLAPPTVRD